MAEVIFRGIKNYGIMHSSQFISDAVIEATRLGLYSIKDYIDLRLKNVDHLFDSKIQFGIKKTRLKENPAMGEYASHFVDI